MESNYSPNDALRDVAATREQAAQRINTPGWYYPMLSLVALIFCLTPALLIDRAPLAVSTVMMLLPIICMLLIVSYVNRTGMTLGWRNYGPRSRRAYLTFCAFFILPMVIAALTALAPHGWIYGLSCGLISAGSALVLGPRLDSTVKQEIRDGFVPLPHKLAKGNQ